MWKMGTQILQSSKPQSATHLIRFFLLSYSLIVANLYICYILHTNSSNCRQIFSINREMCGSKYFCSMIFSRLNFCMFLWKSLQKKTFRGREVKVKWSISCSPHKCTFSFAPRFSSCCDLRVNCTPSMPFRVYCERTFVKISRFDWW